MRKQLVICVSKETGVCSVDPFDSDKEAADFIAKDSAAVYDAEQEGGSKPEISSDGGCVRVTSCNGEFAWTWSTHEVTF